MLLLGAFVCLAPTRCLLSLGPRTGHRNGTGMLATSGQQDVVNGQRAGSKNHQARCADLV
jgi:hypothetical protein